MNRKKWLTLVATIAVIIGIIGFLLQPTLIVCTKDSVLCAKPAYAGLPVTIHFIHSVQKTPVEEDLVVNDHVDGLILKSTRYQSFGVGLPFLEGEGDFREEGDYFIFDNMNRPFPTLTLRPGVGTKLTLVIGGAEYKLYEIVPLGHRVDIAIAPYYTRFLNHYPN